MTRATKVRTSWQIYADMKLQVQCSKLKIVVSKFNQNWQVQSFSSERFVVCSRFPLQYQHQERKIAVTMISSFA